MIDQLNSKFAIEDAFHFEEHSSGLVQGKISTELCEGSFFLLGGHVAEYSLRDKRPILFLSDSANYEKGKAIRGGVPICFPWFGPHKQESSQPAHGLVRTETWQIENAQLADDAVSVVLGFELDQLSLKYTISFGASLRMSLAVSNSGPATTFELALHTYFSVSDAAQVCIEGLESVDFLDQLTGKVNPATQEPIRFTEETDRIYQGEVSRLRLVDPAWNRTISVAPTNSHSTVIWNPWIAKAKRMPDFGDLEYPHMCCIETANITPNQVDLAEGASHTTAVEIVQQ